MCVTIEKLARYIAENDKNFIFIDTCSFLDILRIPYRSSDNHIRKYVVIGT